ncbi:MAG: orotate phosphoribosyltransferase [Alphaproteobacteria bacterium]|nr:orotate phosphoribosyltransferase [Alphaproteobacteria bacterium]
MKQIAEQLLAINAVKLQPNDPFTWASGWKSPIYCDNRKALSDPDARFLISETLARLVVNKFSGADCIVGVATGAIAWGAIVAENLDKPFAYVRSSAKDHGLQNKIEGVVKPGDKVVVIEDLISTGGSSLAAVQALRDAGAEVLGMVAIFSYQFPKAQEAFLAAKCDLYTASGYSELLEVAAAQGLFGEAEKELLAQWRKSPDTWGK